MNYKMRLIIKLFVPLLDAIFAPFFLFSALAMFLVKKIGVYRMPIAKKILFKVGVYPILDHYYEPQFNFRKLKRALNEDRNLIGIDFNVKEQLSILKKFNYNSELLKFPMTTKLESQYHYNNGSYSSGDAEYLYNMVRLQKPKTIIEIGSGNSTLMVINAIKQNKIDDNSYFCEHICIEPYEMPWLEKTEVQIIRKCVEDIPLDFFSKLKKNDILFIDSSHIIRPQGDVLFEYLELIPTLNSGVLIHIHDIFMPKDYLSEWLIERSKFWNEQYLLEAFLYYNSKFEIIGSLNYLKHNFFSELSAVCPILEKQPDREPGSFWLKKI